MVPNSATFPVLPDREDVETTPVPTDQNCGQGEHDALLVAEVTPGQVNNRMQAGEASFQQIAPSLSISTFEQDDEGQERPVDDEDADASPETRIPDDPPSTSRDDVRSYRPWSLDWKWISFLVFVETSIIVAIIALDIVSARNNGIATVIRPSALSLSSLKIPSSWAYGLLWTTLPTFAMKLFEVMWTAAVSATADRQPYVDLCRPEITAQTVKLTILLDYRSYPSLYGWFMALKNKHGLVGTALLLNLITTLSLVPLTSHLFSTIISTTSSRVSISPASEFNGSALTATISLRPAIDLANAIHAYSSAPPAWMTTEYAFLPFNVKDGSSLGNLTLRNATAYSARLDCQSPTYSASLSNGILTLSAVDRGCAISTYFAISNSTPFYSRSWVVPSCKGSAYGRIGLVAGHYDESSSIKLGSPSLTSCIAGYYQSNGPLTQAIEPNSPPAFVSFSVSEQKEIRPAAYMTLEDTLHSYNTFDPASATSVDAFGAAILSAARKQNSGDQFDADVIRNITESLYATVFAAVALQTLFQPASGTISSAQADISTEVTRLYVFRPIAWVIVGMMALILACTVALFVYARFKESILTEEPLGLLGAAVVLDQSDVGEFVRRVKAEEPTEANVQEFIQAWYPMDTMRCWFDTQERKVRMRATERLNEKKTGWKRKVRKVFRRRKGKRAAATEEAGIPLTETREDGETRG